MKEIVKGTFRRNYLGLGKEIRTELDNKIIQIEKAKDISQISGMILLEGFSHHYRIKVDYKKKQYRIISLIRNHTIYLLYFIHRRTVYNKIS